MQVRKIILSTQKDKAGECAVYVEIMHPEDHKYKRINTNIRTKPSDWSKKKGEVLKSDGIRIKIDFIVFQFVKFY